jgi:hypothetical protein
MENFETHGDGADAAYFAWCNRKYACFLSLCENVENVKNLVENLFYAVLVGVENGDENADDFFLALATQNKADVGFWVYASKFAGNDGGRTDLRNVAPFPSEVAP